MSNQMVRYIVNKKGFTLIEIMIAIVISLLVVSSLYMVYTYNQKMHKKHEVLALLQQNLRAGMYLLENEIRMAGLDPLGSAFPQIIAADSEFFHFQMDTNKNGNWFKPLAGNGNTQADSDNDPSENVFYGLNDTTDTFGLKALRRGNWGGGMQPMIANIEILDFRYYDQDNVLLNPDDDDETPDAVPDDQLQDIRSVEITLISRSDREYKNQNDTRTYTNLNGMELLDLANVEDHYFRKTLSKRIHLRNM